MSKRPVKEVEESSNNCVLNQGKREDGFKNFTADENRLFVEELINNLLSCEGLSVAVQTMDMIRVSYLAQHLFKDQGRMVEIDGPVTICGDLHGQFPDLIRIFGQVGFPPDSNYLFLGDYADRGTHNMETILLCLAYKVRYPNNFFMLRGNHEMEKVNSKYGFSDEVFSRVGQHWHYVYDSFTRAMRHMPLTALVGGRILCMHGGLSPKIENMDSLRNIPEFDKERPSKIVNEKGEKVAEGEKGEEISEFIECDILWSDPAKVSGWQKNVARGASYLFGEEAVLDICKLLDIDLVIRGHQCVQDGYEFFANRHLVTVFSAPHYMGTFTNSAAVCKVTKDLEISFVVLRPDSVAIQERVDNLSAEPSSGL